MRAFEGQAVFGKAYALNVTGGFHFAASSDKFQFYTLQGQTDHKFFPCPGAFQRLLHGMINLVFNAFRIMQFRYIGFAFILRIGQSVLVFKSFGGNLITLVIAL